MARTHYQTGSLYVAGKRAPTWYGRFRDSIEQDGKVRRIYRNLPLGRVTDLTKAQAKRLLAEKLESINSWNCKPRRLITFREFAEEWLELAERDYRAGTWESIKGHVENYLKPFFGETQVLHIGAFEVRQFLSGLKCKDGREMAATTRQHIYSTFRAMWRAAVEWDLVESERPVRVRIGKPHWEPRRILTRDELQSILAGARAPFRYMYRLMAERGALSISEVCGLNVGDLEQERPVLHVRRAFTHGRLGAPKARARERSVMLSKELHERLLVIAGNCSADSPLFANSVGGRWDQLNILKRELHPLCDTLKIPHTGFHAFRHFAITAMGEMGVPLRTAAAWVGHSDPALTMRVYMHARPDDDGGYTERLAELLKNSRPSVAPKRPVAQAVMVGST